MSENQHTPAMTDAEEQNIKDLITRDPAAFLALMQTMPEGQKVLEQLRQQDHQRSMERAIATRSDDHLVSADEAMDALERLSESSDTVPQDDAEVVVRANDLKTLIEYARQQSILNDPNLYVLQDSRSTPDNQMLFWAHNAKGYTTDLTKAHRFTELEALAQQQSRSTDIAHRVGDLAPATGKMLGEAAKQIARLEREVRDAQDPLRIPRPRGVDLSVSRDLQNYGDHGPQVAKLKAMFDQTPGAINNSVLLAASKEDPTHLHIVAMNPSESLERRLVDNPNLIVRHMEASEFAASFWRFPDAHRAMSYQTWSEFSELVQPHLDKLPKVTESVPAQLQIGLPADYPPALARERMSVLDSRPSPQNLQVKMALAEIEMASLYGEPVNPELFTPAQLAVSSWSEKLANTDLRVLHDKQEDMAFMEGEFVKGIQQQVANGQQVSQDDRFTLALMRQFMSELERQNDSVTRTLDRAAPSAHASDDEDDDMSMSPL